MSKCGVKVAGYRCSKEAGHYGTHQPPLNELPIQALLEGKTSSSSSIVPGLIAALAYIGLCTVFPIIAAVVGALAGIAFVFWFVVEAMNNGK